MHKHRTNTHETNADVIAECYEYALGELTFADTTYNSFVNAMQTSSSTFDSNELLSFVDDGAMCACIRPTCAVAHSTTDDAGADAVCSDLGNSAARAADNKSLGRNITDCAGVAGKTNTHTHTRTHQYKSRHKIHFPI